MAFGKISGGYEIRNGVAAGLLLGAGLGVYLGPVSNDNLNDADIRDLSACIDYEQSHPEAVTAPVPVGSIPPDVLAACSLTTYVVSPNNRKIDSMRNDAIEDGAKVIYNDVDVQLPNLEATTDRRDGLQSGPFERIVGASLLGTLGAFLGLTAGLVRSERRKRLANESSEARKRYSR